VAEESKKSGTTWVLRTDTKGTGAQMVPLEDVLRKPGSDRIQGFKIGPLRAPATGEPEPEGPHLFKIVDVMTRQVLGEDVDARETVRLLEDVGSIVDVSVYVWEPASERWRMLTFGETRALWEYRGRLEATTVQN
jgi:hypothetical protein